MQICSWTPQRPFRQIFNIHKCTQIKYTQSFLLIIVCFLNYRKPKTTHLKSFKKGKFSLKILNYLFGLIPNIFTSSCQSLTMCNLACPINELNKNKESALEDTSISKLKELFLNIIRNATLQLNSASSIHKSLSIILPINFPTPPKRNPWSIICSNSWLLFFPFNLALIINA